MDKKDAIFVLTCVLTCVLICGLILHAITPATNSNRTALSSESLIIGRADFNKQKWNKILFLLHYSGSF